MSYWGPNDASVYFCEDKYKYVYFIAEYYNTMSSLCYIIIGCLYLKDKISYGLIWVGVGSILLHGTLRWYGQWVDEIAMLTTITYGIEKYKPNKIKKYYLPSLIFLYLCFNSYFIFLSGMFVGLSIYLMYITKNKLYILFTSLGSLCWLSDKLLCHYMKHYNLHMWWHIFTSFGIIPLLSS